MARVRNDEQYELRRTKILSEAAKVFRAKGYHSATMEDLANALGVTKAAVYYYYPKKHDILLEICEQAIEKALERIRETNESDLPPAERLQKMIADHVEIMTDNLEEWAVFFQEIDLRRDPRARKVIAGQIEFGDSVEALISAGVKSGEFRPVDAHLVTLAILGMCNWLYRWFRIENRTTAEVVQQFDDLILNGLWAGAEPKMRTNGGARKRG